MAARSSKKKTATTQDEHKYMTIQDPDTGKTDYEEIGGNANVSFKTSQDLQQKHHTHRMAESATPYINVSHSMKESVSATPYINMNTTNQQQNLQDPLTTDKSNTPYVNVAHSTKKPNTTTPYINVNDSKNQQAAKTDGGYETFEPTYEPMNSSSSMKA